MDAETKVLTAKGPMTLSAALSDPAAFAGGMSEEVTYSLFVPFTPTILVALLRSHADWEAPIHIEPYTLGDKAGSLVTTAHKDVHDRMKARFHHTPTGDENAAPQSS